MALMRAFVGIAPDRALGRALEALCARLQQQFVDAPLAWVDPANFHITLAFIGRLPADDLARASPALGCALRGLGAIEYTLQSVDCFPDTRRPRVLAALPAPSPGLESWQAAVAGALLGAGIAFEQRRFRPHLTLARWRGRGSPTVAPAQSIDLHGTAIEALLYESRAGRYLPQLRLPAHD